METSSAHWLPLTEYALRSGMSISTLRRKIKSQTIEFKMEDGRYLIRSDDLLEPAPTVAFTSSDQAPRMPTTRPSSAPVTSAMASTEIAAPIMVTRSASSAMAPAAESAEFAQLREELRKMQEDNLLRWKALEARVAGLAKKLEFFSEQMAETKMLVKLFEEKLDSRA